MLTSSVVKISFKSVEILVLRVEVSFDFLYCLTPGRGREPVQRCQWSL